MLEDDEKTMQAVSFVMLEMLQKQALKMATTDYDNGVLSEEEYGEFLDEWNKNEEALCEAGRAIGLDQLEQLDEEL
jgi:hypothetical protein